MVQITEQLVRKKSEHNECLISTLEELSLHQEDIEKIEHIHNWCRDLKILLLQSNLIAKIENLFKFKKLEYLNLAVNNIEKIENLEGLESLNKLDLTLNFIGDLTSVESLRGNYNLRQLFLTGNPCTDYSKYREYVIVALPQLDHLDSIEIKMSERLLASKDFQANRAAIIQQQAAYNIQRDEQKIRYMEQKADMERKMESIDNEDDRIKLFWDTKTEHCPEVRNDIHIQQKKAKPKTKENDTKEKKKPPILFAPCGRPYNLNQPKLDFAFHDEAGEYVLELSVYKYLDTAYLDVDVQPKYIRVNVKGKIFQLALADEVRTSDSIVQRSQITGELLVKVPKVHYDERLARSGICLVPNWFRKPDKQRKKSYGKLYAKRCMRNKGGTVDYRNIVESESQPKEAKQQPFDVSEVPDLE